MESAISVRGIAKSYKRFTLKNLEFEIPEGAFAGLIGTDGSGKTSAINAILGLMVPASGAASIFGKPARSSGVKDRIGIILDDGGFFGDMKVKHIAKVTSFAYSKWDAVRFGELVERFELPMNKYIKNLKKPQMHQLSIALALSHHADMLIIDEPASGFDAVSRSELIELIREYRANNNCTVLFATHDTSDLEELLDYVVLIDEGRIVLQGEKHKLLDAHYYVRDNTVKTVSQSLRGLFKNVQESAYGIEGITTDAEAIKAKLPKAAIRRAEVADLLLYHVKKGYEL